MYDLMQFVPPNFSANASALVIESANYLPQLREKMPAAKIILMTTEPSLPLEKFCAGLNVDLMKGDYLRGALPNEPKSFDVVIADDCLTNSLDTYATLAEISRLLKDAGFLLTQFFNARFIGMLESLRQGQFPTQEKKFWAKWDVVKLLHYAVYKEIHFLPYEKFDATIFPNLDDWLKFGFDNFSDDLLTKIWLVKACKCEAEIVALKEFFSQDVRAELSRRLHRIEYGIDVEENISKIRELCTREMIFEDYLRDFIAQVIFHDKAREFILQALIRN